MSDFNWCHGPQCHEKHTVDRVRGVKGSKVLRTRKIKWNNGSQWSFFCSNHCQNDFWKEYATQIVAIAPRTECQETPINDPIKTRHSNPYHSWYNTEITVDESRQS
jgi:hypothetical protein